MSELLLLYRLVCRLRSAKSAKGKHRRNWSGTAGLEQMNRNPRQLQVPCSIRVWKRALCERFGLARLAAWIAGVAAEGRQNVEVAAKELQLEYHCLSPRQRIIPSRSSARCSYCMKSIYFMFVVMASCGAFVFSKRQRFVPAMQMH
jgi:hypothetical protein